MSWIRDDDRDNFEFWEQQKNEYLKQNPSHGASFNEEMRLRMLMLVVKLTKCNEISLLLGLRAKYTLSKS